MLLPTEMRTAKEAMPTRQPTPIIHRKARIIQILFDNSRAETRNSLLGEVETLDHKGLNAFFA
jgi:hypothetical protein